MRKFIWGTELDRIYENISGPDASLQTQSINNTPSNPSSFGFSVDKNAGNVPMEQDENEKLRISIKGVESFKDLKNKIKDKVKNIYDLTKDLVNSGTLDNTEKLISLFDEPELRELLSYFDKEVQERRKDIQNAR